MYNFRNLNNNIIFILQNIKQWDKINPNKFQLQQEEKEASAARSASRTWTTCSSNATKTEKRPCAHRTVQWHSPTSECTEHNCFSRWEKDVTLSTSACKKWNGPKISKVLAKKETWRGWEGTKTCSNWNDFYGFFTDNVLSTELNLLTFNTSLTYVLTFYLILTI
jgi:hypothetical protein